MNTTEAISALRSANPVPGVPVAPPIERVLRRIDEAPPGAKHRPALRGPRRWYFVAGFAGVVALVMVMTLLLRSEGGDVDVAAAATRAIDPGSGIVHAVMSTTTFNPQAAGNTQVSHIETWLAPKHDRYRSVRRTGGDLVEWTVDRTRALTWSSRHPLIINEQKLHGPLDRAGQRDPVSVIRDAYSARELRVVGRMRVDGQSVWRLQSAVPARSAGFSTSTVVDVNAESFIPVRVVSTVTPVRASGGSAARRSLRSVTTFSMFDRSAYTPSNAVDLKMSRHPGAVLAR